MNTLLQFKIILVLLLFSTALFATEIRGRIDTQNPYTGYYQPLPRAEVALVNPSNGRIVAVTYTGMDGFYYFYGIYSGNYILRINRSLRIPVYIPNNQGYDINPVLFR